MKVICTSCRLWLTQKDGSNVYQATFRLLDAYVNDQGVPVVAPEVPIVSASNLWVVGNNYTLALQVI